MIELKSKFAKSCKIFIDEIEQEAISSIMSYINSPIAEDCDIRIMPDVHAGAGCVIGFTSNLPHNRINPNVVGVDIGCGLLAYNIGKELPIRLSELDGIIKDNVAYGFSRNSTDRIIKFAKVHYEKKLKEFEELSNKVGLEWTDTKMSIGSLGGGNHFIEVGLDEDKDHWFIVHSGSRKLGFDTAKYYQNLCNKVDGFLGEKETKNYLYDMRLCKEFSSINREMLLYFIFDLIKYPLSEVLEKVETIHNYIDTADGIIRKGAVESKVGKKFLLPINMAFGTLLCEGSSNPDWNYSAPHGAGRILSRSGAKKSLSVDEFKSRMDGIYSSCVDQNRLDESPMAYKSPEDIINSISDSGIKIIKTIKSIYNFKG